MTFQCSVDGSEWTPCSSPFTAGPLAAGDPESGEEHEFEVRAVSRFTTLEGEPIFDETPARYEWTVFPQPDPPAFDTIFTSTPPAATAGGPDAVYLFSFEARDGNGDPTNLATFECSLDGEPYEECEPPLEYDGARRRHAHAARARGRPGAPGRRDAGEFTWTIEPRRETSLSILGLPAARDRQQVGDVHVQLAEPVRELRVRARHARVHAVQLAADVQRHPARRARVPGARQEPGRQRRPDAGDPPLDERRHDRSGRHDRLGAELVTEDTTATFTWTSDDPDAQYLCTLDGAPDPAPVSHQQRFCSSGVTYDGPRARA